MEANTTMCFKGNLETAVNYVDKAGSLPLLNLLFSASQGVILKHYACGKILLAVLCRAISWSGKMTWGVLIAFSG